MSSHKIAYLAVFDAMFIESCHKIAPWLSAALEDPKVCEEYKADALEFLNCLHTKTKSVKVIVDTDQTTETENARD